MKEIDFDQLANRVIAEWQARKDDARLMIKMSIEEQIEVLKLIKKMRE